MSIYNWSTNPANNGLVDGIVWSEAMLPSQVNDSARQMMADVAGLLNNPVFQGLLTSTSSALAAGGFANFGDNDFYATLNGGAGGDPVFSLASGSFLRFLRSVSALQFIVQNVEALRLSATKASTTVPFEAPRLQNDVAAYHALSGGNPTWNVDLNDLLYYHRAQDKWYFRIGGVDVMSIDATGTIRAKGSFLPNQATV